MRARSLVGSVHGVSSTEYVLLVALVALAGLGAYETLGVRVEASARCAATAIEELAGGPCRAGGASGGGAAASSSLRTDTSSTASSLTAAAEGDGEGAPRADDDEGRANATESATAAGQALTADAADGTESDAGAETQPHVAQPRCFPNPFPCLEELGDAILSVPGGLVGLAGDVVDEILHPAPVEPPIHHDGPSPRCFPNPMGCLADLGAFLWTIPGAAVDVAWSATEAAAHWAWTVPGAVADFARWAIAGAVDLGWSIARFVARHVH